MDKTKIGVGHILSMGWNELTARAPLMLGLIGMLAAGDFFISWLQLTTNLAGSADLGFIIVHMTFAMYITRVVLLQDTDLRKGPMAAYIGHSFLATLATLAVMLPLIVASGILVAWGTAGDIENWPISIFRDPFKERATLLLVCLIIGSFSTLIAMVYVGIRLYYGLPGVALRRPDHGILKGWKEAKGVVWPLIGAHLIVFIVVSTAMLIELFGPLPKNALVFASISSIGGGVTTVFSALFYATTYRAHTGLDAAIPNNGADAST